MEVVNLENGKGKVIIKTVEINKTFFDFYIYPDKLQMRVIGENEVFITSDLKLKDINKLIKILNYVKERIKEK